ncbi:MAG: hypothetical protein HZB16_20985 [Armatimonadetes bacterium]|nr:hypothetical protein [Armatimonadota bacterium]
MATERLSLGPIDQAAGRRLACLLLRAAEREVEGAAVTSVSFGPAPTAHTRLDDLPLTLTQIARRLGRLSVRHHGPARSETCAFGGPQTVTGADIALATGLDVSNPDLEIVRVGPRGALEVTLVVEVGHGQRGAIGLGQGSYMPLPVRFTPLVAARVDWADEHLLLDLTTDDQMSPALLLRRATELLPADQRDLAERLTTRAVPPAPTKPPPGVPLTLGRVPRAVDWLAGGRAAFEELIGEALSSEIARRFPLDGPSGRRRLAFAGLAVVPPPEPWSVAAIAGRTWLGEVLVGVELHGERGQPVTRRRLRWASLPWLTERGTFIVDGREVVATTRTVAVGDGFRLQRAAGQLLDQARRTHNERLDQLTDGLDTDADAQDLVERLGLSAVWLDWLRRGPTARAVSRENPLALADAVATVHAEAHEAAALGLKPHLDAYVEPVADTPPIARAGFASALTLPLDQGQVPWVGTGLEREVAAPARLAAPRDGLVEALTDTTLRLGEADLPLPAHGWRPRVQVGERVSGGDALADGPGVLDGELALGRNLLVGWCDQWPGGLVVSDRLVAAELLSHTQWLTLLCPVSGEYVLTRSAVRDPRWLDQRGVVRVGAVVAPGEPLVARLWRHNNGDATQHAPETGDAWQVAAVRDQVDARGAVTQVALTLAARVRPRAGDRLRTRRGLLGDIAAVAADLPRLPDGRSLDVVLPGTPGPDRTEATLGLAAMTLGQRIIVAPGYEPAPAELGEIWHQAGLPPASALHPLDARDGRPLPGSWAVGVLHVLCG